MAFFSIASISDVSTFDVDTSGALQLNSSAGAIGIGNDAVAQAINIGTGAAARTITVGNVTGASAVNLNSGTGGMTLASTGAGDITINSDDTLLLDADGVLELNSSAGAISIGNDAVAQAINIGTGSAARTITVGNNSGATSLVLTSGTGDIIASSTDAVTIDSAGILELNSSAGAISIGNDAVAQAINIGTGAAARTITVGNVTGATAVNLNSGTGGMALASTGAGDITINSDDTLLLDSDGVLELNSSAGIIKIGNDDIDQNIEIGTAGERTINIATGSFADTVNIGNTTGASAVNLIVGTGGLGITLGSDAEGDMYYRDSNNNTVRLARGTDNYVMAMNGNVPNWEAGVLAGASNTFTATNTFSSKLCLSVQDGSTTITGDSTDALTISQTSVLLAHVGSASTQTYTIGDGIDGQIVHFFFTTEAVDQIIKLDFGATTLASGSGLVRYLTFKVTGQSATLIFMDARTINFITIAKAWRIINTGAAVS